MRFFVRVALSRKKLISIAALFLQRDVIQGRLCSEGACASRVASFLKTSVQIFEILAARNDRPSRRRAESILQTVYELGCPSCAPIAMQLPRRIAGQVYAIQYFELETERHGAQFSRSISTLPRGYSKRSLPGMLSVSLNRPCSANRRIVVVRGDVLGAISRDKNYICIGRIVNRDYPEFMLEKHRNA